MAKLTKKNYFSKENTHITNSKVSDFLVSKEYYYQKHVACTLEKDVTPSMILGSMVDLILSTGDVESLKKEYRIKALKKDDSLEYDYQQVLIAQGRGDKIVSQDAMDKAIKMSKKVIESPIYAWLKENKAKFQVLLTAKYDNVKVAGMLDCLVIEGDTAFVIDFKTSAPSPMRSAKTWFWNCFESGYLRQLAHYGELVKRNYEDINNIVYLHIVIGSSEADWFPVKVFEIADSLLNAPLQEFYRVSKEISEEKDWKDTPIDFSNIIMISDDFNQN